MYLIFDTETTGLPTKGYHEPISDVDNWPRLVQIAWQLHDANGVLIENNDFLIQPEGFNIPYKAEEVHGISTELAAQKGQELTIVLEAFSKVVQQAKFIVGHNVDFDVNVLGCEFFRLNQNTDWTKIPVLNTCTEKTASLCQIKGGKGGKFKLPTLSELHLKLFGESFNEAHNATADVEATTRSFLELIRIGIYTIEELNTDVKGISEFKKTNPAPFAPIGLTHVNLKKESDKIRKSLERQAKSKKDIEIDVEGAERLANYSFTHKRISCAEASLLFK